MRPPADGARTPRAVAVVLLAIGLTALGVTLARGPARAQESQPTEADGDLVQRGLDLFGTYCATCHGAEGRGIEGQGPNIQDAPPALVDFVIRTGRMPLPHPDAASIRREPELDAAQRRAIVAYFTRRIGPDDPAIPEVSAELGDLSAGQLLYEENCIACHSAFGNGVAVSEEDIAPPLHAASPVEIAEAVRTGPGVMPIFSDEQISGEEVDSLVAYVLYLRDPATPGGIAIGLSGPVSDGVVAFLGAAVLVVGLVYIGERRRG